MKALITLLSKYKYYRYSVFFIATVVSFAVNLAHLVHDEYAGAVEFFKELVARDKEFNQPKEADNV